MAIAKRREKRNDIFIVSVRQRWEPGLSEYQWAAKKSQTELWLFAELMKPNDELSKQVMLDWPMERRSFRLTL